MADAVYTGSMMPVAFQINGQPWRGDVRAEETLLESFIRRGAAQCGFCTAGMLLACTALLQAHPQPTREHIGRYLNSRLCRCGAYVQILEAIQDVAEGRLG